MKIRCIDDVVERIQKDTSSRYAKFRRLCKRRTACLVLHVTVFCIDCIDKCSCFAGTHLRGLLDLSQELRVTKHKLDVDTIKCA